MPPHNKAFLGVISDFQEKLDKANMNEKKIRIAMSILWTLRK